MDARQSRRAAEKRARELISQRATLVGDLAIAHAERDAAMAGIDDAREQGRQLVREAEERAAQLQQAARETAEISERAYSEQHAAAVDGGWSAGDLEQLGYTAPARRTRPRTIAAATDASTPDNAEHLPAGASRELADEQRRPVDDAVAQSA